MARREETRTKQVPTTTTYSVYTCDYCRQATVETAFSSQRFASAYPKAWVRVALMEADREAYQLQYGIDYLDACGKCAIGVREGMAKRAGLASTPKGDPK